MRLTEIILINIWVERIVVGWLKVITRANLGNFKIFREFHKAMAVVTMLYIHAASVSKLMENFFFNIICNNIMS